MRGVLLIGILFSGSIWASTPCDGSKFVFDLNVNDTIKQSNACQNDGSLEFCLLASDKAAEARILAEFPNVQCSGSHTGRIGCDLNTQVLCLFEVSKRNDCVDRSAMKDANWENVCRLTQVPEIEKIGRTWYE